MGRECVYMWGGGGSNRCLQLSLARAPSQADMAGGTQMSHGGFIVPAALACSMSGPHLMHNQALLSIIFSYILFLVFPSLSFFSVYRRP